MSKISSAAIAGQVARESVGGFRDPDGQIHNEVKLPPAVQKKLALARIDPDAYLIMLEYAKYLPRGKRKLKLDLPELRDMLVAHDLEHTPLTKTSGLNMGGMVAQSAPPKLELLDQRAHLFRLINKNKEESDPNPTYWKNNVSV